MREEMLSAEDKGRIQEILRLGYLQDIAYAKITDYYKKGISLPV